MKNIDPSLAYAIQAPSGAIMACTTAMNKSECYSLLWDNMDEMFRSKYWKRMEASMSAYRRAGYRCVRVVVSLPNSAQYAQVAKAVTPPAGEWIAGECKRVLKRGLPRKKFKCLRVIDFMNETDTHEL